MLEVNLDKILSNKRIKVRGEKIKILHFSYNNSVLAGEEELTSVLEEMDRDFSFWTQYEDLQNKNYNTYRKLTWYRVEKVNLNERQMDNFDGLDQTRSGVWDNTNKVIVLSNKRIIQNKKHWFGHKEYVCEDLFLHGSKT